MKKKVVPTVPSVTCVPGLVLLGAEPEPLEIDLRKTAVMVVDMQNAFVSKGGMFDLRGLDVLHIQKVIEPIKKVANVTRLKGVKVVYIITGHSSDLREGGGPNSPNWYKRGVFLSVYRGHPEWQGKLLARGTWGAEIVEDLKPQEGDIVVEKPRYSAFFGTNLDMILKTY